MFWERFYELCTQKGSKPNAVAKEISISSGILTKWKTTNSLPNGEMLNKIADYFNCSVDYLLGRDNAIVSATIFPDEQRLLDGYRQLNSQGKEYILQTLDMACSVYTKNTEIPSIEQETNAG